MFRFILYSVLLLINLNYLINPVKGDNNFKVDPNDIQSFVYHLELEGVNEHKFHYIGLTKNLNQRWAQHLHAKGSKWTKLHKPVKILDFWMNGSPELENTKTYELMDKYGIDRVRGGVCHCPVLSECRKFGCKKSDEVYSGEDLTTILQDAEQIEIEKRIRFILDNDWVKELLFTFSSQRTGGNNPIPNIPPFNYNDKEAFVSTIKNTFKKQDGQWYMYSKNNGIITYSLIRENSDNIHIEGGHEINIWYFNKIYNLHYKIGNRGMGGWDTTLLLSLYNYFKP